MASKRVIRVVSFNGVTVSNARSVATELFGCTEWLGAGAYGAVYAHPLRDDRVIKVCNMRDAGYRRYVRMLIKLRKHNPWLPRVHDAIIVVNQDKYAEVKTEYRHVGNTEAKIRSSWLVVELDRLSPVQTNDGPAQYDNPHYTAYRVTSDAHSWADRNWDLCHGLKVAGLPVRPVDRAAERIIVRTIKPGCPDLHEGNIMWNGTQLVYTDPACA